MSNRYTIILCFLMILVCTLPSITLSATPRGNLTFSLRDEGVPLAKVVFACLPDTIPAGCFERKSHRLTIVCVPFQADTDREIEVADDVSVAILEAGLGHSLILVEHAFMVDTITLGIYCKDVLKETKEGRLKIKCDLSYQYASLAFREFMSLPFSYSEWDMSVILPEEYETDVLSLSPNSNRPNPRTITMSADAIRTNQSTEFFVAFPNPLDKRLGRAKFGFSILIGALTALLQITAWRQRRLVILLAIFVISSALIIAWVYFSTSLAKALEFNVWAGISIPHAIVSFLACLYILIARRLQATIHGRVTLNKAPLSFAEVTVFRGDGDRMSRIASTHILEQGNYVFHVWVRKGVNRYQVSARIKGSDEKRSPIHEVKPGERQPFGEIDLIPRVLGDKEGAGASATP